MALPPPPPALSEDAFARLLGLIGGAFAAALLLVTGVAWLLAGAPTLTPGGLALGAGLGVLSWIASRAVMSWRLGRTPPAPDAVSAQVPVRVMFFLAVACTEAPALLGFVVAQVAAPDVGAITIAGPAAAAAIWLNLAGPAAVRSLLERAQGR